ncbi:MAG: hypothetical protein JKY51_06635, partial [Opitutaceae bacterium]|nr:hypothetical protein [Opitutaceae bacterium]
MIELSSHFLSFGIIPGVLCGGYFLFSKICKERDVEIHQGIEVCLSMALGLLVWSVPLVVLPLCGWYSSWSIGLAGWIITGVLGRFLIGRIRWVRAYWFSCCGWAVGLIAALTLVSGLFFYVESMQGGIDEGVYAAQAKNIYHTGGVFKSYPVDGLKTPRYREFVALMNQSGMYATEGKMTV